MSGQRRVNDLSQLVSNLQSVNSQLEYFEVEKFKLERREIVDDDELLRMNMGIETRMKLKKECEENIKNQRNIIRKEIDEKYKNKTLDDTITDIAIELEREFQKPRDKLILEALFISLKSIS